MSTTTHDCAVHLGTTYDVTATIEPDLGVRRITVFACADCGLPECVLLLDESGDKEIGYFEIDGCTCRTVA